MPKKTKRGRAFQSKKKRAGRPAVAAPAAPPVTAEVATPPAATPTPSIHAARTKTPAVKYPYVPAELRRISILAGIILVILVILALVL